MGAPESGIKAAEQGSADTLLSALRTIRPAERAKHETILDYWLSIRGDKDFPPLHDLDPLEISDAGPCSILLELISGGQDAEIRHLGDALNEFCNSTRIIDAPNPSILHSIARKLPIVAISRDILAFEDDFNGVAGRTRCWVTLLPLSSCGSWVDYVYAFVSVETANSRAVEAQAPVEPAPEPVAEVAEVTEPVAELPAEEAEEVMDLAPVAAEEPEEAVAPVEAVQEIPEQEPVAEEAVEEPSAEGRPGFSTLLQDVAKLAGFYGQGIPTESIVPTMELTDSTPEEATAEPEPPAPDPVEEELPVLELDELEPVAEVEEPVAEAEPTAVEQASPEEPESAPEAVAAPDPTPAMEGALQKQLSEVRAMGEEARQAQIRATAALYEGLSAAYDFALDAESQADEYFKLVQEKGLKVQLRAPMAPVAKLAFDGVCDAETIAEFEAILAWALKEELPRGTLAERIDQAGGISELLNGVSRPS